MDALWSTARTEKPDLVVAHDFEVLRAGAALRRWNKIPLIYDAHEDYPSIAAENSDLEARIAAREERRLCRRADHVITVSEPLAEKYRAWGRPATVLYNSRSASEILAADRSESRRRFGYSDDDFVVGFTGALAPGRGLDILIDALMRTDPAIKALIVGGPDDEVTRLRARAEAASLSARVRIDGHLPYAELAPYYAAMDLGVMLLEPRYARRPRRATRDATRTLSLQTAGNLSNKLFDYLAHGLPILVPDYPAMARLVQETRAGVVLPRMDVTTLAETISAMREEREGRISMSASGRDSFVSKFSWDRQEYHFHAIVKEITGHT